MDKFEYGALYKFSVVGSCDTCGSPHNLVTLARYVGYYQDKGDMFEIPPFGCPGCHKTVDTYFVREDLNVTKEMLENKSV